MEALLFKVVKIFFYYTCIQPFFFMQNDSYEM